MSISVTCPCGARLEIDEKFLGKDIPCPDCSRLLPTKATAAPPPLELPDHRRVSGLAVLSLTLAIVGAFTIVGTLAAIGIGIIALRRIARQPTKLDGAEYARAGIIAGGILTLITLAALISPTVFGIDQFLRELTTAKKVTYPPGEKIETDDAEITRPSPAKQWARFQRTTPPNQDVQENHFILYSTRDDAYIACQFATLEGGEKIEEIESKILEQVYKSELLDRIGRLGGRGWSGDKAVSERKPGIGKNTQEITVDLRIAGVNRRLLIQYTGKQGGGELPRSTVLIACARANRFSSLEDDFRQAFASFKAKNN
jgi:hypothetical protein